MLKPVNLKDLQTFLRMVQYLRKFSPRIAEIAELLQDLMKKHASYAWGPEHNHTFDSIKKRDCSSTYTKILQSEEGKSPQTDASIKGLGTCLLQDGHPIYFAGKSLQNAEC